MTANTTQIENINIAALEKGKKHRFWLKIYENALGKAVSIPIIIAKGHNEGPIMGLTAAVHGNELNGISVLQRFFEQLDVSKLNGTIIGVLVMNVPAFMRESRRFTNFVDLNRIMPGKENGESSDFYAFQFIDKVVKHFDYLIDLHTASRGRINSYYIRVDLQDKIAHKMALLHNPHIIVNSSSGKSTLRMAASSLGVNAITVEVGDPSKFQEAMINYGLNGIINCLAHFKMLETPMLQPISKAIICTKSYWIYTKQGGILEVLPNLKDCIKKNEKIAVLKNIFGDVTQEYFAPENGIVVGKSVNPLANSGARILHLGIPKEKEKN